jgi:hypothetical protein
MKIRLAETQDVIEVNIKAFFLAPFSTQIKPVFYSTNFDFSFNRMKEYWREVGKRQVALEVTTFKNKIPVYSKSWQELASDTSYKIFGAWPGVILTDISPDYTRHALETIGTNNAKILMEDFVFMRCETREQALKLARSIPRSLAAVIVVDSKFILFDNEV